MLRRRLLMITTSVVRIYGEVKKMLHNSVRTIAASIPATLAKLESVVSDSYMVDSTSYEASVSNIEVNVGTNQSLNAFGYKASNADVNVAVSAISDISSEAFNASVGESKTDVSVEKNIDALSAGASVGDVQKVIKIESSTEPLSGDAKLNQLKIKTHDIPTMIAVASSKIYSQIDTTEGVVSYVDSNSYDPSGAELELSIADSTLAVADKFESEPVTMNTQVSAGISAVPGKFAAITTNSATNGMMIVTFAPMAKTVTWLDPILTDGVLYIRQAMNTDHNQKNKTLEVI